MFFKSLTVSVALIVGATISGGANATLTPFKTWVGNVGYSSDGFGSLDRSGTISASVPAGSTVLAAYLYTGTWDTPSVNYSGELNGVPVSFINNGDNSTACCGISSGRADVTGIVAPIINGGPGGIYDFTVTEGASDTQDGEALVVVYSNPANPESTFAILDGFASVTGDTAKLNFSAPLDPTAAGFNAEMFLGINFSCCDDQRSTVKVNGTTITENAGNNDDGLGFLSNGQLITVGGFNDPFSPLLPSYADDHERYNLKDYITKGDTAIVIETFNASQDDNIFLAGIYATGKATFDVPEPESLLLFGLGLAGFGFARFAKKAA